MDPREIQSLEELCVEDDSPWCQAACPLHVDARAMLVAVARGDFEVAAGIFAKKVPFPGILSRVCEQPCRPVCKRGEAGDSIQMGLVERSCAHYGGFVPEGPRHGLPKEQRIAVVGAGLSGLTAALALTRKHYKVTLFEAADRLGGRLRLIPAGILPPEVRDGELSLLQVHGVEVRMGVTLGRDVGLADLARQWDAVYVAVGRGGPQGGDLEAALGAIDPVTLATRQPGVFAGGSMRRADTDTYAPAQSMCDGEKAATSIDRFVKGESIALHREKEGSCETRLFTSLQGVEPASAVVPGESRMGYSRDEAAAEAGRCLQCECLECVKACTYLEHFREYPGKCIRKVTKNIASLPGKSYRTYTPFLNSCSLCGLCGAVCPTDLDMAVVNGEARRIMWDKGFMPPAIHEFAIRDMAASNTGPYSFARNQPGTSSSTYLFFPGCQLVASSPDNVEKTYRFLTERLDGGVGFTARCCGAPAAWSGRQQLFGEVLDDFTRQWDGLGRPRVVLACPTCSLMFTQHLPRVPTISLWGVLHEHGLPEGAASGGGRRLALHDSCTARSVTAIQDSVRAVIDRLGYEVEELPYSRERTKCCGYGGLMYAVNRELTGKVIESRVAESDADYVTYCTNCRDFFASKGKASYHVLDLVFGGGAGDAASRPGPTWSERRANRRRLAERMLTELWGEPMPEPQEHMKLKLRMAPEVAAKMERDFILEEDVQRVIYQAEKSGNKLRIEDSGRFVAHYRPSLVTYWVEYAPAGYEYEVFNAYSHRMQIVRDVSGDAY